VVDIQAILQMEATAYLEFPLLFGSAETRSMKIDPGASGLAMCQK
jgi:hypothetical protein